MADCGLVIFDLDGTLADTRADLASAVNRTRVRLGLDPVSFESVVEAVGNGVMKLLERTIPELPEMTLHDKRAVWMEEYMAHLLDQTRLYPGVEETLKKLYAAGWRLAVLSNKPDSATKKIIEGLGIAGYFSLVQGGSADIPLKPDPAAVEFAIRESGYTGVRSSVWMVGDNYTDLESARRAGISRCFCEFGFGHAKAETPTLSISSMTGFADRLLADISVGGLDRGHV